MPITRPTLTKLAEYGVRDGSSSRATLAIGEVSLTRKLRVFWDETGLAAQHFLGYSRVAGGRLERLLPAPHPDDPTLVATRISIVDNHRFTAARGSRRPTDDRLPDQSVAAAYGQATIEVQYERPMYTLLEDSAVAPDQEFLRFVDWGEPQPTEEVFTQPGHTLNFVAASGTPFGGGATLPVGYNVPRVFPLMDFTVTWKRLPADLFNPTAPGAWLLRMIGDPFATPAKLSYQGMVNKEPFGPFPAGTALLRSWRPVRRPAPFVLYSAPDPGGPLVYQSPAVEWDIEFQIRYDPKGHNRKWYSDPVPPSTSRSTPGASGLYFVGAGTTHYAPGLVPDDYSLFNERPFADLFNVNAIP